MQNGTEIAFGMHSRNFENRLFNLYVGKSVGGKSRKISGFWHKIPCQTLPIAARVENPTRNRILRGQKYVGSVKTSNLDLVYVT